MAASQALALSRRCSPGVGSPFFVGERVVSGPPHYKEQSFAFFPARGFILRSPAGKKGAVGVDTPSGDDEDVDLKGTLLISNGSLFDPNFRQTVVVVADHSEEGALGVVLNRPAAVTVADAVPVLAPLVPAGENVFIGGPVQTNAVVVVAESLDPVLIDIPIVDSIGLLSREIDDDTTAIRRTRVFAGYSGWGPGQLEAELSRDDWILEPALPEDIFTDDAEHLWSRVLKRKGGEHALLATMPFDPSSN